MSDAGTELTPDRNSPSPSPRSHFQPAFNYIIVLLMGCFPAALLLNAGVRGPANAAPVFLIIGFFLGQFVFYVLLAGLLGDSWLDGLGLSWVLCLCASVIIWISTGAHTGIEVFVALFSIPWMVFLAATPLLLCRMWMGWQLRPDSLERLPRTRLSIEDLVLVPACVVSLYVFARVPAHYLPDSIGMTIMASSSGVGIPFFLISLFFLVPLTFVAFRSNNEVRWVFIWMVPPIVGTILMIGVAVFTRGVPGEVVLGFIGTASTASGVVTIGLFVLWFGGYRLINRANKPLEPSPQGLEKSPLDAIEVLHADPRIATLRTRQRVFVLVVFAVVTISNIIASQFAATRIESTLTSIEEEGGRLERENGRVVAIHFGPRLSEFTVNNMGRISTVKSVTFDGTMIDFGVLSALSRLPLLDTIDFSRTEVDGNLLYLLRGYGCKIIVRKGQLNQAEVANLNARRLIVEELP